MKKINVVQYGCGKMSKYTMRYVYEKGGKIVGAFDIDENKVGKDISTLIGGKDMKVKIRHANEFEEYLKNNKPDCVIITTMSLLNDLKDVLLLCAKYGVNALTTCEEALYPQNSNPTLFNEIDKLAKKNKCTIAGCGYQDVFWGNLITTLAGSTHNITKIKGKSSYNVEDYGIALAEVHGAGLSLEEFEEKVAKADEITEKQRAKLINKGEFMPSYMWNVNGWLASQLGLTVTKQIQKCVPQVAKQKLHSDTLNMDIPKGHATGMSAVVLTETKEGITLETECIGKVYDKTECDVNDWTIIGEPNTQVVITRPCTVELTCADIVNRIPHVMNAPYGFYTTEKMDRNKYMTKSMEKYLK